MLSEDLFEKGGNESLKKKFFDIQEKGTFALGRLDEKRDLFIAEIICPKLKLSQGKLLMAGLMALSSRLIVVPASSEDLQSTMAALFQLLPTALLESFDLSSSRSFPGEDLLDVASNELAPRLTIWTNGNAKLLQLVKDEGKSAADLLDSSMQKTGKDDLLRGQFMVIFKARELLVKDHKQASFRDLMLEAAKEFGPRRIRLTPAMAASFLGRYLSADTPLRFRET